MRAHAFSNGLDLTDLALSILDGTAHLTRGDE